MKIEFVTKTYSRWGEDIETHVVRVDGKDRITASEGIEPEDTTFYRDLTSPHDCDDIIREAIEATKRGETVEFDYIEEEDN